MKFASLIFVFFVGVLTPFVSVAGEQLYSDINISADIKPILSKEMLAIENGMQEMLSSIAKGEWDKTAAIGEQLQASYILKQSLTKEQLIHLHQSLPGQFIRLDHDFHKYAGLLADAAKAKNADVTQFYFYKMNVSCVQCHSRYAKEHFPGLSKLTGLHPENKHK